MARRSKRRKQSESRTAMNSATTDNGEPDRPWILFWLVVPAVLAYATAVPGDFVWLDHAEIEEANYRVVDRIDFGRIWHETIEQYQGHRSGVHVAQGGYWRPVYALAISLDWGLWNGRPWLYHIENILWHITVVLLLYAFGIQVFGQSSDGRRAVFWATVLFAVHPFGVHSVTWISGRKDTMCAVFALVALIAFGRATNSTSHATPRRSAIWYVISGLCYALAVGSKELGFVVPILAAVFYFPPLGAETVGEAKQRWSRWILGMCFLAVCTALFVAYRVSIVEARGLGANYPTDSVLRNLATSTNLWWHYVVRILFPFQVRLSDAWPVVQTMTANDLLSVLAAFALAVASIFGLYRRQLWAFGIVWFVIWMLPVSGIIPLRHFRAERYLYPASWGILFAAMTFLLPTLDRVFAAHARRASAAILCLVAAWYAVTTARENVYWWNDESLFMRSVLQDPYHVEGRFELSRLALGRQDYPETARLAREGLEYFYDRSYLSFGVPFYAYQCLGVALVQMGQPREGVKAFDRALEELPGSSAAYSGRAMAHVMAGDLPAGKRDFLQALAIDPGDSGARNNLVMVLIQLGQFSEAEPQIERLIRTRPEEVSHLAQLAWIQWKLGRRDTALQTLETARAKGPNDPTVLQVREMIGEEQTATESRP